jgi:hypothetical protein
MLFEYENIVIGSDTRALLYAFINEYPVFYTEPRVPHRFDFLDLNLNTDFLHIDNSPKLRKSFNSDFEFGERELLLWEKLNFLLSVEGLAPLSNLCETIRYDGEKLVCSSEYSKLCEIKFDKCYYFGDNKTYRLVTERKLKNERYRTFDRLGFHKGGKHAIDYAETDDDFVRKVWFYSSDRICGNTGVKDACVLSILTAEQLRDPSYTPTMSAFKLIHLLKQNGMRGKFHEYTKNGTPRYYNFRTSNIDRQVFLMDRPEWDETNNVKKVNQSIEELIVAASEKELSRYRYLNEEKPRL